MDRTILLNKKLVDISDEEKTAAEKFHKNRIAFAWLYGNLVANEDPNDDRDHRQWLKEDYNLTDDQFEMLPRGYMMGNGIFLYIGSAHAKIPDLELSGALKDLILLKQLYKKHYPTTGNVVPVYNGVHVGKVGEIWDPISLLLQLFMNVDDLPGDPDKWVCRRWRLAKLPAITPEREMKHLVSFISTNPVVVMRHIADSNYQDMKLFEITFGGNGEMLDNLPKTTIQMEEQVYRKLRELFPNEPIVQCCNDYILPDGTKFMCHTMDQNVIATVAFETRKMADEFTPPDYFGEEIDPNENPFVNLLDYWNASRLNIAPKIVECSFNQNQNDPTFTDVMVKYDNGREEKLFSYDWRSIPNLKSEEFIGMTRGEALNIPFEMRS